jgi:hypothetical protein
MLICLVLTVFASVLHLYLMHCIILFLSHICLNMLDHVEPESEIQAEQVQWVFRGPQASSCEDAIIVVIKANPGASKQCPCLLF